MEIHFPASGFPALSAGLAAGIVFAACASLGGDPAVRIDPDAPDLTARWNADLVTPRRLAGAVGISGTAWMAPEPGADATEIFVEIENATPGGVHPWRIHRGRCGTNRGAVGSEDTYPTLEVGEEGRASAGASLDFAPDDDEAYYVAVYASPTNRDLIVACGNLAPPAG